MTNKTGPKPKPKDKHYKAITVTLPPELYFEIQAATNGMKLSPTVAKLIQTGLNAQRAYTILNDAFGHADAPYTPEALRAMAVLVDTGINHE